MKEPISRRRFVALLWWGAMASVVSIFRPLSWVGARSFKPDEQGTDPPPTSFTRAGKWSQLTPEDFARGHFTNLTAPTAGGGTPVIGQAQRNDWSRTYTSPPQRADFPFNALGAQWKAHVPKDTRFDLEIRSSPDGQTWSQWLPTRLIDQFQGRGAEAIDLVMTSGRYFQYRAILKTPIPASVPQLNEITITYIDSSQGPTMQQARDAAKSGVGALVITRPSIISRTAWGADESYRFSGGTEVWPPQYSSTVKLVIHHTVTANNDPNPAATVRAIYYYHAVTLGWGDVGYNFVVDPYGNLYEGRYGGDNVIGGHVAGYNTGSNGIAALGEYSSINISPQLENALVSLLSYECQTHGIDPRGSGSFGNAYVANICGHRDLGVTVCPGDLLYAYLPTLQAKTQGPELPVYGETFQGHNTPADLLSGQTVTVNVTVANSGSATWATSGPDPFRIGYHWYNPDGTEHIESPSLEYHTNLPGNVAPGQTVTVAAALKVPAVPGTYVLKWDMVHEHVTWFTWANPANRTLDVAVRVFQTRYAQKWISHGTPTFIAPGRTAYCNVVVENNGSLTWVAGGTNPYRIGYHWFRRDGSAYDESPSLEKHTGIPNDVRPGERVTIRAELMIPLTSGSYIVKWDMVQEWVTWFAWQGNQTLDVPVLVQTPKQRFLPQMSR